MGNSVYESIMTGLNEALADAQSEKPILKRYKVTVEPVKVFEADEVKKNRNSTGMSQKIFASYMGCLTRRLKLGKLAPIIHQELHADFSA